MKKLAYTIAIISLAISIMSCMVTTRTTTTYPDGRVEVVERTEPAAGTVETAGALLGTAADIAAERQIHREK